MHRMKRTFGRLAVGVLASTLLVTGCGRDDEEGSGIQDAEPCPDAVNEDNGCIYLGVISDLSGPFQGVGKPLTDGGKAFWDKVNEEGGIGGYDIDVTTYRRDNQYDPAVHAEVYAEIKDEILAMGQSLGTVATEAMLDDPDAESLVTMPATLGSNWLFEDRVLELGTSYCAEAMNMVDYGVDTLNAKGVAAVHFPGDYGDDAMVGARIAADERGIKFTDIETGPGAENQSAAVRAVLNSKADVVVLATGPAEVAAIVGGAVQAGFKGKFVGSIPTWNAVLLESEVGPALQASYLWATSFPLWDSESPGFEAMREANGEAVPNDYFAIGWSGGYVLKAVIEQAIENDDLTQEGLLEAATNLTEVDSEGMLPEGSANYAGEPNDAAVRATLIGKPTPGTSTGISVEEDFFTGPTAEAYDFQDACYSLK